MISDFEKHLVEGGIIDKNDIRYSIFFPHKSKYFVDIEESTVKEMMNSSTMSSINFDGNNELNFSILSDIFFEEILKNKDNLEKVTFFIKNNPHRMLSFKFVGEDNQIEERLMRPKDLVEHYVINKDTISDKFTTPEKIEEITNILNLENYFAELNKKNVLRRFKDKVCTINGEQALYLFECSKDEYEDFFDENKQLETIFGLNKKEYLTLVKSFIEQEQIKDFNLGIKREYVLNDIMNMRKIDFQTYAMNLFNEDDEEVLYRVNVNPDFYQKVVGNIPKDYSDVEKAIYIYSKLCRLLKYDPEFYLQGQSSEPAEKHRHLENLALLGKESNDIICYDFAALYASILHDMGIDVTLVSDNETKEFGEGHSYMHFIADKFYVKADSTTSIFSGDIIGSKVNNFPNGISCLNISNQTVLEFNKILDRVYSQVLMEEIKEHHFDKKEYSFDSMIEGYHKVFTDEAMEQDFEDKLNIMIANVRNRNLSDMDSLFYMNQLRRSIFSADEKQNNISLIILKENDNNIAKPSAVLTLSNNNNAQNEQKNYYLYNTETKSFKWAPKDMIYEKLQDKTLEYVGGERPYIPDLSRVEYYDGYEMVLDFE